MSQTAFFKMLLNLLMHTYLTHSLLFNYLFKPFQLSSQLQAHSWHVLWQMNFSSHVILVLIFDMNLLCEDPPPLPPHVHRKWLGSRLEVSYLDSIVQRTFSQGCSMRQWPHLSGGLHSGCGQRFTHSLSKNSAALGKGPTLQMEFCPFGRWKSFLTGQDSLCSSCR